MDASRDGGRAGSTQITSPRRRVLREATNHGSQPVGLTRARGKSQLFTMDFDRSHFVVRPGRIGAKESEHEDLFGILGQAERR